MKFVASLIAIAALFGFMALLALICGLLLGYWHLERQEAEEDDVQGCCNTCRHSESEWEDAPCNECSDDNPRWEAVQ